MASNNEGGSYAKTGGERRKRTVFSEAHIELLKKEFEKNMYPGYQTREALARHIGVEEDRVHTWFQNRRARTKIPGSKTMTRNRATTPYSRWDGRSSVASGPTQQFCQPRSFHYPESYGGAGFWQPPLSNTQPGEHLYAAQQQNSQGLNPLHYQPAAVGGTGFPETSQGSNCPVPYYGAEMVRQTPPSAANFCSDTTGNSAAMGNYPADGSVSGSQFFPSSQVSEQNIQTANPIQMLPEDYQNWQQTNIFPSPDTFQGYPLNF